MRGLAVWLGAVSLGCCAACAAASQAPDAVTVGHTIFNTQWSVAAGLGPLFNATSCNQCHAAGAQAPGPQGDGAVPIGLVIQLQSPGDPTYGQVLSRGAVNDVAPEAKVSVSYREVSGYYYPFGGRWTLRTPHYTFEHLSRGPLAPTTIIKPRVAPALFGVGLLDLVPPESIDNGSLGTASWQIRGGARHLGRFGWQASTVSLRDQTTHSFALELGLTTHDQPADDCTPLQIDCRTQPVDHSPEVADALVEAVVAFERSLPAPAVPEQASTHARGKALFSKIGCDVCHRAQLPIERRGPGETVVKDFIAPYTDLRLHDLGDGMADETVSGTAVKSLWRTAPLWGLRIRMAAEHPPTFLHDGRARTTEEAVLWHEGEAARSRYLFQQLGPNARGSLLRWLETL